MASSTDGMVLDNDDSRDNPHSSFGYIVQDDGSDDVYVHAKALNAVPGGVLGAGDKVEYRVAVFNERPRAKDVRVLKRA